MAKILAQAGNSLADVYDVEGSIAGVEKLVTEDVVLVHEMGDTIFSERFSGQIRTLATGDILQDTNFTATDSGLADTPTMVNSIIVFVDVTARLLRCSLMIQSRGDSREIPIWVWDGTNEFVVRFDDGAGGGVINAITLFPRDGWRQYPVLLTGREQPERVETLVLRGTTSGFGAGTVEIFANIYVSFADVQGLSSRGLPIPGW